MDQNPLYAIRDVPGKGKGLVAIEEIPEGTRILCEDPIVTVPQGEPNIPRLRATVARQVDALEPSLRQAFLSMHNIYPHENSVEKLYWGIIQTNALPVENGDIASAIFLEACRINHACDRNAQKSWNDNIKKHTVHALRGIKKGEEITIYYLGIDKSRDSRIKSLKDKFGFFCSCRLCSLSPEKSRESDRRLDRIHQLDGLISQGVALGVFLSSPLQVLRYVDEQVRLYNEQGPNDAGLPRAFFDAAQVTIANGDLARGRIFAERAVSGWRKNGGSDCQEVLQFGRLANNPSTFEMYGVSTKWKTAIEEVPRGLEQEAFEDWLWRRDVPQRKGQPADLRNRSYFPAFDDLPTDRDFASMGLYEDSIVEDPQARRRHWCFLAEIVDYGSLLRLQAEIKDVDGKTVPLFFYTEDRGREVSPADICNGYTVAILDARHHAFVFDRPGIRHENPRMMKVPIYSVSRQATLDLSPLTPIDIA
ncbi:hypothetical protein O1611_g4403 [Lasiodiplodia mahajangana]|uniref:Uncharacterized protein n=1 Tax=Lasiodiplodia mahajangana TaxID=1108764 RepID=A0ACC2JP56_9PEZI|nr:hypothetical protein O1611_g4403 [Lasiodiplodia mahajangana]